MIMPHPLSTGYHHLLRILSCSDIPTCMEYLLPDFVIHSGGLHEYHNRKILQQELVLRISTRSDRIYIISQSQTMSVTQNKKKAQQVLGRTAPFSYLSRILFCQLDDLEH